MLCILSKNLQLKLALGQNPCNRSGVKKVQITEDTVCQIIIENGAKSYFYELINSTIDEINLTVDEIEHLSGKC